MAMKECLLTLAEEIGLLLSFGGGHFLIFITTSVNFDTLIAQSSLKDSKAPSYPTTLDDS